jgi:hypothetical protein
MSLSWLVFLLFVARVAATRLPLATNQHFTFADVNLVYSIPHFDIRASQPHPRGYPPIVLAMCVLSWLRFHRVETILPAIAGSAAALSLLVVAGDRVFGGQAGFFRRPARAEPNPYGSPPLIALWKGPRLIRALPTLRRAAPLRMPRRAAPLRLDLPAGAYRLLSHATDFCRLAGQNLTPAPAGSLAYTDVPLTSGSRIPGAFELAW